MDEVGVWAGEGGVVIWAVKIQAIEKLLYFFPFISQDVE